MGKRSRKKSSNKKSNKEVKEEIQEEEVEEEVEEVEEEKKSLKDKLDLESILEDVEIGLVNTMELATDVVIAAHATIGPFLMLGLVVVGNQIYKNY